MARSMADRFWPKVARCGPGECWPWQAQTDTSGYGIIWDGKRRVAAHRFSWELANGRPIPEGFHIDHLCRRRECVNPAHLDVASGRVNFRRARPSAHILRIEPTQGGNFTVEITEIDARTLPPFDSDGAVFGQTAAVALETALADIGLPAPAVEDATRQVVKLRDGTSILDRIGMPR